MQPSIKAVNEALNVDCLYHRQVTGVVEVFNRQLLSCLQRKSFHFINYTTATTSLCSASYFSSKHGIVVTATLPCCGPVMLPHRPGSNQSTSPTCQAHSSKPKPTACSCSGRTGQTDRRTPYRYINPALHTMQANKCSIANLSSDCISYKFHSFICFFF